MPSVDEILASPPLAGLRRVTRRGGNRQVVTVRLAEQFSDLNPAPARSMVILSRAASAAATDYRLHLGPRWAAVHIVAAFGGFADGVWQPPMTAVDIAARADIALVSVPAAAELTWLLRAIAQETGGGAERALARAEQGLAAVLGATETGTDLEGLRASVSRALGIDVEARLYADDDRK